ncbi:MAG: response regulator transcription factor [Sphingobacteriales bacterium]|nr:MAG: response regulator transcription factor [Sphingobacteriales bacterium]
MITAIAIDDEPLAINVIRSFCERTDLVDLKQVFTGTGEAMAYLQNNKVDLLFLDIQMPGMSGIDFYRNIPQQTMVIFTTAYSQYAVEGFDLSAIDYLLKPFEYQRFLQAVQKAKEYYEYNNGTQSQPYLFIKADYSVLKIALSDILYIEGLDNYLKIHLQNAKPIVARMSMKNMMEKLPEKEFVRAHRSYIVSVSRVTSLRNKVLYLDKLEIPVGVNYNDTVNEIFGDKR